MSLGIEQFDWFSSAIRDIAVAAASSGTSPSPLYLHISIYITRSGNPDVTLPIPNCDVIMLRPSVYQILRDLIDALKDDMTATSGNNPVSKSLSKEPEVVIGAEESVQSDSQKLPCVKPGEGLAVCASGPASLTREVSNAFFRVQLSKKGRDLGMIGLHTEVFAL